MVNLTFFVKNQSLFKYGFQMTLALEISELYLLKSLSTELYSVKNENLELMFGNLFSFGLIDKEGKLNPYKINESFNYIVRIKKILLFYYFYKNDFKRVISLFEQISFTKEFENHHLIKNISLAYLGMPKIASRNLKSVLKDSSNRTLLHIFIIHFYSMSIERENQSMESIGCYLKEFESIESELNQIEYNVQSNKLIQDLKNIKLEQDRMMPSLYSSNINSIQKNIENTFGGSVKEEPKMENSIYKQENISVFAEHTSANQDSIKKFLNSGFQEFFIKHKINKNSFNGNKFDNQMNYSKMDTHDKKEMQSILKFRASVIKHKEDMKKSNRHINSELIEFSKFIMLSNISQSVILEYEKLLILTAKLAISNSQFDILDHLLSFYDCYQFFESDFRMVWGYYSLFIREFQDSLNSFSLALKKNESSHLAHLGISHIFLSGGSKWVNINEAINSAHLSENINPTSRTYETLSCLYDCKGDSKKAAEYSYIAFETFLSTPEIDLNFINTQL